MCVELLVVILEGAVIFLCSTLLCNNACSSKQGNIKVIIIVMFTDQCYYILNFVIRLLSLPVNILCFTLLSSFDVVYTRHYDTTAVYCRWFIILVIIKLIPESQNNLYNFVLLA